MITLSQKLKTLDARNELQRVEKYRKRKTVQKFLSKLVEIKNN